MGRWVLDAKPSWEVLSLVSQYILHVSFLKLERLKWSIATCCKNDSVPFSIPTWQLAYAAQFLSMMKPKTRRGALECLYTSKSNDPKFVFIYTCLCLCVFIVVAFEIFRSLPLPVKCSCETWSLKAFFNTAMLSWQAERQLVLLHNNIVLISTSSHKIQTV